MGEGMSAYDKAVDKALRSMERSKVVLIVVGSRSMAMRYFRRHRAAIKACVAELRFSYRRADGTPMLVDWREIERLVPDVAR